MTATLESNPDRRELERRLDELIPRSAGPVKTLAISVALVGAAIAVTVLTIGGYLYPRPTFSSSFGSDSFLEVDRDRGAVSATVLMPNFGSRTVRITGVAFDAAGAELVDVGAFLEPPFGSTASDSGEQTTATTPFRPRGDTAMPLPIVVPPGRTATIVVWFRPTECTDQPGPWGFFDATVDFGDGAFPPLSNTVRIAQDPVAFIDPDLSLADGSPTVMLYEDNGSMTGFTGPLAAACEALR